MTRYCPKCGKADSKVEFIGELCTSCASARVVPFPTVRVAICQNCGALMDKGRQKKNVTLEEEVIRILKLRGQDAAYNSQDSTVQYDTFSGRVTQEVLVLKISGQCIVCSRAGSQYFEAIIQLRGNGKKVERMASMISKRLEKTTFIPKVEELKEGLNLYVGSRNDAIAALNTFKLSFLRTEKLAGERNGKRLYRTTLLVRL